MSRISPKLIVQILTPILIVGFLVLIFVDAPQEQPAPVTETTPETNTEVAVEPFTKRTVGSSVSGRPIEVYTFGSGENHLLFVGGIHGGYEWNSILLAYTLIDQLTATPSMRPENVKVSIIPSANPDGLFTVLGKGGRFTLDEALAVGETTKGRFNINNVDLNRNFDCKWQPESTWRGTPVSAGTSAFSEPEARAIRDFVLQDNPDAVIFFHSQASAVYASECHNGILPVTRDIMNLYAQASGYKAVDTFDAYPITGDAEGWLASIDIPAITVELATHQTIEWDKNLAGITALFEYFRER